MSRIYMVTYDLRAPGRDYKSLYEALKSYGTWAHVMESSWAIATSKRAGEVHDHLRRHMDANDRLMVARLQGEAAWSNLDPAVSQWLKEQLERCAVGS